MTDPIEVRPFVDSDLDEVLELMRLSLGEPPGLTRTLALFAWKHFDNPFGRSLLLVAQADGRIAGFRAFMRWDLAGPGRVLRCVRAVDTATHPDFQRRGIFRRLTLAGIEHATTAGLDLIFNTPNQKSGPGYLQMGWQPVGKVGVLLRPGIGLVSSAAANWEPAALESDSVELAMTRLRTSAGGWRTPRHIEYLRWRYESHPTARYITRVVDNSVAICRANVRRGRNELVVSELGGSAAGFDSLRRALRPAYSIGWFSPGPERQTARRGGMMPIPRLTALSVVARPLRPLDVDLAWDQWDVSLGDFELL